MIRYSRARRLAWISAGYQLDTEQISLGSSEFLLSSFPTLRHTNRSYVSDVKLNNHCGTLGPC
jgi:hypothetical protein